MQVSGVHFQIVSRNSNTNYWVPDPFPQWARLRCLRTYPGGQPGEGVEPHYHDADEIWLFGGGHGEVWVDGTMSPITPNTLVYTPMGSIHRFQMFSRHEVTACVTRLERDRRPLHLYPEEHGAPLPTAPPIVVAGADNVGPLREAGDRCPLHEMRSISFTADGDADSTDHVARETLDRNEHWAVFEGELDLEVDGCQVRLAAEDIALMRAGAERGIRLVGVSARATVVRERSDDNGRQRVVSVSRVYHAEVERQYGERE